MTADADKPKKSRWRLSGLRGKKSTDPMEIDSHDSTYGGSDASAAGNANETSASLNTNESNAPSNTTTQAQQASPREGQGTVVETTTTTTTITRTFAGGTQEQKVEETRRDDTGQLLERKPVENTSSENMPPENTSSIDKFQGTPDTVRGRETNSFRDGPSPTSPGKTNYSYPRNSHSGSEGRSGGTLEGLKTAAAGIHVSILLAACGKNHLLTSIRALGKRYEGR